MLKVRFPDRKRTFFACFADCINESPKEVERDIGNIVRIRQHNKCAFINNNLICE